MAFVSKEGCLSFPEVYTDVRRYENVIVKAMDSNGRAFVIEANDGCLLAKAIQHEFDHLEGILFIDHARNRFEIEQALASKKLPPLETSRLLDESEIEAEILSKLEKESK